MHQFPVQVRWHGHTHTREYPREATADAEGKPNIPVSTAEIFGGSHAHWNPEELFGAALSTCHMETFLSLAQKVGVDVTGYHDRVEVTVDTGADKVSRITNVTLRPVIELAPGSDAAKALTFFHKAHKYCFVANSTTAEVVLEPTFV